MTNDKGESVDCEVILTIDSDEFGKSYIVYTDHTMDDNGNINTYASIYDPTGNDKKLHPIETEEEWDFVEKLLANLDSENNSEE